MACFLRRALSAPQLSCLSYVHKSVHCMDITSSYYFPYTVEPLTNDHPHQRPSLSYDHISYDGQWFMLVYESLTSDHPSYTTTPMWFWGWSYKRGSTVAPHPCRYISPFITVRVMAKVYKLPLINIVFHLASFLSSACIQQVGGWLFITLLHIFIWYSHLLSYTGLSTVSLFV